jgi:hypothetical protein
MQFFTILSGAASFVFLLLCIGTICQRYHSSDDLNEFPSQDATEIELFTACVHGDNAFSLVITFVLFLCFLFTGFCSLLFYVIHAHGVL